MTKTQELQSLLDEIIKEYPDTLYTHVKYWNNVGWYLRTKRRLGHDDKYIGKTYLGAKASLESYRDVLDVKRSGGAA